MIKIKKKQPTPPVEINILPKGTLLVDLHNFRSKRTDKRFDLLIVVDDEGRVKDWTIWFEISTEYGSSKLLEYLEYRDEKPESILFLGDTRSWKGVAKWCRKEGIKVLVPNPDGPMIFPKVVKASKKIKDAFVFGFELGKVGFDITDETEGG